MRQVVDASVVLAYLLGESGGEVMTGDEGPFLLSSVNLAEVLTKAVERDLASGEIMRILQRLPLEHVEYGREHAELTAALRAKTMALGLSLGDRACVALAVQNDLPVLTAERIWAKLDVGVDIRLIR